MLFVGKRRPAGVTWNQRRQRREGKKSEEKDLNKKELFCLVKRWSVELIRWIILIEPSSL